MSYKPLQRNVFQSVKKIYPLVRLVIGKHIYEALEIMGQQKTKGSRMILSALQMVRHHAINRGLDDDRLFVQAALTNKYKSFRGIRYHAKGRGSRTQSHTSQIRVTLEEKPS